VLDRVEQLGMIVDLAHASERTIDDVLAGGDLPLVVSHTGVRATCDSPRNLSDRHIAAIAAKGGLIGIGFFEAAVCGTTSDDIARAMAHAASVGGVDHVALGSDFDGAVATPFDTTGLAQIVQALIDLGVPDADIVKMIGGNAERFLLASLR
jgi:microsomal dipeptidase-like Zn-dependent dipeptidase